jgi:hypothetical protein
MSAEEVPVEGSNPAEFDVLKLPESKDFKLDVKVKVRLTRSFNFAALTIDKRNAHCEYS